MPGRPLNEIAKDGFRLTHHDRPNDYALTSLGIALRAYVSTPHALHGNLHLVKPSADPEEQQRQDFNLFSGYHRAAFETVIHLQHFAELVVKEALRQDHDLLVVLAEEHHTQLHDLIHGKTVPAAEYESLRAIEFSVALTRACDLIDARRLDAKYAFIRGSREFLQTLNGLRNRAWHRGTFVLRYRALDELVGRHALPFVDAATRLPPHDMRVWRHKDLDCGIDPLPEIAAELGKDKWSVQKVAFLKELARAAYENPLVGIPFFADDDQKRRKLVEATVDKLGTVQMGSIESIGKCPVCGMTALVIYSDFDDGPGGEGPHVDYTWLAKCEGCTLELRSSYGNPSEHGWAAKIEDYWRQW